MICILKVGTGGVYTPRSSNTRFGLVVRRRLTNSWTNFLYVNHSSVWLTPPVTSCTSVKCFYTVTQQYSATPCIIIKEAVHHIVTASVISANLNICSSDTALWVSCPSGGWIDGHRSRLLTTTRAWNKRSVIKQPFSTRSTVEEDVVLNVLHFPLTLLKFYLLLSVLISSHPNTLGSKIAQLHLNKIWRPAASCLLHRLSPITNWPACLETIRGHSSSHLYFPGKTHSLHTHLIFFLRWHTHTHAALHLGNSSACTRQVELTRFIKGMWSPMLSPLINLNNNPDTDTCTRNERRMRDVKRRGGK